MYVIQEGEEHAHVNPAAVISALRDSVGLEPPASQSTANVQMPFKE